MSWDHQRAAFRVTVGDGRDKAILMAVAFHACEICGLAWPGVRLLAQGTEFGATSVRAALQRLIAAGHLSVRAYAQGGRGRSTEYVVLPRVVKLSTPPCAKCQWNMQNPPHSGGYDKSVTGKSHRTGGGYQQNPPRKGGKTHHTGDDQSSVNLESSGRASAPADPQASPGGAATPPPSDPTPLTHADALRQSRELTSTLGANLGPESTRPPRKTLP